LIFQLASLTPAARLFPTVGAKYAGRAGWLAPLFGIIPYVLLLVIFASMFKNDSDDNPRGLGEIFETVYGKWLSKLLFAVYLAWVFLSFSVQIRYYAERMVSTIMIDTDIRFFIGIMMILVFMATRGRIETFARFAELMVIVFTVLVVAFFILMLPTAKIANIWPVTYRDVLPAARATTKSLSMYAMSTFMLFFGDKVVKKNQLKKKGLISSIHLMVMATLITLFSIASLGHTLVAKMPNPFFGALKMVTFLQPFDRIEAILLSSWVIADFVLISALALAIAHIAKKLFNASDTKYSAAPIAFIGFIAASFLASSYFELERLSSSNFVTLMSAMLGFAVPAVTLAVGKARKVI
jgi:spore germination protein KB